MEIDRYFPEAMEGKPCDCGRGTFKAMTLMASFSGDLNCTACNRRMAFSRKRTSGA